MAVANIDIATVLAGLLRSKREIIRLQALKFVYDRMLGKPKQDVNSAGWFTPTPAIRSSPAFPRKLSRSSSAPTMRCSSSTSLTLCQMPFKIKQNQTEPSKRNRWSRG